MSMFFFVTVFDTFVLIILIGKNRKSTRVKALFSTKYSITMFLTRRKSEYNLLTNNFFSGRSWRQDSMQVRYEHHEII